MMGQHLSSLVTNSVQGLGSDGHFIAPTWLILAFLIVSLVVLKKFIYIRINESH